tara:strand:- start:1554 stop:2078 length:525 start_codon:yes stop_codon:yes gene_type:complete
MTKQINITLKQKKLVEVALDVKKSLDGNIMIFDHKDIDIVIIPEGKKVVTFPKSEYSKHVYPTQDKLFNYLRRDGVIKYDSIRGGNIFMSMEAIIAESEEVNSIDATLYSISKFMIGEREIFDYEYDMTQQEEDYLTEPTPEDSTALGEVPQEPRKGSIIPGVNPYGMPGQYNM